MIFLLTSSSCSLFLFPLPQALLLAINDSVPVIDLEGVQLLSIEETLPLTGPSSEQLVRGAAASSSSSAAAVAAAAAAAAAPSPRAPPRRRSLRQSATSGDGKGNGNGNGGPTAEEAHVHATVLLVPSNARDLPAAKRQLREAIGGGAPASSPLARAMLERGIPTDKVGLISLTKSSLGNGGGNAGGLGASVAAAAAGARQQQEQELQREGATATSAAAAADDGGLSNGAIAGVVAGVVAFVAVSACLVAFVVRVVVRRSNGGGSGAGGVEKGLGGIVKGGGDNKVAALDLSTPFSAASAASPFANARMMPSVRPSTAGSVVAATAALATAGSGSGSSGGGLRLGRAGSPPAAAAASAPNAPSRSASEAEAAALDVPFSELKLIAPIGEGAYGRVWLARWRETAVAVKVLIAAAATAAAASAPGAAGARFQHRIGGGGDNAARQQQQLLSAAPPPLLSALRREAGIMSRLRHPNVLQYLGTVAEEGGSNCSSCSSVAAPGAPASSPAPAAAAASCPHPVTAVIAEYCPHGSVADLLAAAREAVEREERSGSGKDAEGSGSGRRGGGGGGRGGGDRPPRPDPRAVRAVRQWETRLALALGAAKGMLYLHSQSPAPVLHRDLKAANVLVDGSMRAKVADFNLAREEQEEGRRGNAAASSSSSSAGFLSDFSGPQAATTTSASSPSSSPGGGAAAANNPRWLAPEVLRGEGATTASDVYSFGVFLWELACWETPWARAPGGSWAVAIGVVERGERPPLPPAPAAPSTEDSSGNASGGSSCLAATPGGAPADEEGYLSLMASCWAQDPRERPGFAEVIARLRPVAAAERLRRGGA